VATHTRQDRDVLAKGFQGRVRKVLSDTQYKNPYGFTQGPRSRGFSHATLKAWLRTSKPRVPVTPALIEFAQLTGASLDYLILGEGPEFRGQALPIGELAVMLRAEIARRLTDGGFPLGVLIAHELPDGDALLRQIANVRYKEWRAAFLKRFADDAGAAPVKGDQRAPGNQPDQPPRGGSRKGTGRKARG